MRTCPVCLRGLILIKSSEVKAALIFDRPTLLIFEVSIAVIEASVDRSSGCNFQEIIDCQQFQTTWTFSPPVCIANLGKES